jgi:hypothetical protein
MVVSGIQNATSFGAQRICAGVLAAVAWFGLGIQIVLSLRDAATKNVSIAMGLVNHLSLFSIQTNVLVALVGTVALVRPNAQRLLLRASVQSAVVVYVIVVGVVFEVLLRSDSQGMQFVADRVLHAMIPILYLLYWLIFAPRGKLSWVDPILWLIYPVLFFVWTMIRGAVFGVYPPLIKEVVKQGYHEVFIGALAFFAAFLAIGLILVSVDQALGEWQSRRRSEQGQIVES